MEADLTRDYIKIFDPSDTEAERFKRLRQARGILDFLAETVANGIGSSNRSFDSIMSILESSSEGVTPSALKTRIKMRTSLEMDTPDIEQTLATMVALGLISYVEIPPAPGVRGRYTRRYVIA